MKTVLFISIALFISGCGAVASKKADELMAKSKPADWGVLQADHQEREKGFILKMLKDPDSAKFRFTPPTRGLDYVNYEPVLVWISSVHVNAKNAFGGYVGERPYAFSYRCPINQKCNLIDYAIPHHRNHDELEWQR